MTLKEVLKATSVNENQKVIVIYNQDTRRSEIKANLYEDLINAINLLDTDVEELSYENNTIEIYLKQQKGDYEK